MANVFPVSAIFRGYDQLTPHVSKLGKSFISLQTRAKMFGGQFAKMGGVLDSQFKSVAGGIIGASAALAAFNVGIRGTLTKGMEFQKTLAGAGAKFSTDIVKGTKTFAKLEEAAKLAGLATEFTASQSAAALEYLALAGFTAEGAISALPGVIDLATAANVDLARSTDIVTDSLGIFGLMSTDSQKLGNNLERVNDVMVKTANSFNTNLEQLFEASKMAGVVGTDMGITVEQFSAFAGVLGNAGMKGTLAGTSLRNVFLRLSAPAGKGAKALKKLGISVKDSKGNFRDAIDIFGSLEKKLSKLSDSKKMKILKSIFQTQGMTGASLLLKEGAENLRKHQKMLEESAGSTTKVANIMRATTSGKVDQMKSSFENLQQMLFSKFEPTLQKILDTMTNLMNKFSENKRLHTIIGLFTRFGGVFLTVITSVKLLTVAFRIFNAVVRMNPIVRFITIATGFVTLLYNIIFHFDELTEAVTYAWESILAIGSAIGEYLTGVFQKFMPWLDEFIKKLDLFGGLNTPNDYTQPGFAGDFRHQKIPMGMSRQELMNLPITKSDNDLLITKNNSNGNQKIGGQIDVNFNNAPKNTIINSSSKDITLNVANSGSF